LKLQKLQKLFSKLMIGIILTGLAVNTAFPERVFAALNDSEADDTATEVLNNSTELSDISNTAETSDSSDSKSEFSAEADENSSSNTIEDKSSTDQTDSSAVSDDNTDSETTDEDTGLPSYLSVGYIDSVTLLMPEEDPDKYGIKTMLINDNGLTEEIINDYLDKGYIELFDREGNASRHLILYYIDEAYNVTVWITNATVESITDDNRWFALDINGDHPDGIPIEHNSTIEKSSAITYQDVIDMIAALNEDSSAEDINAAKEAYSSLSDEEKALVTNYEDILMPLLNRQLSDNADSEETEDPAKTDFQNVINLINALTKDSSAEQIKAAEDAYSALNDDMKSHVLNYDKLNQPQDTWPDSEDSSSSAESASTAASSTEETPEAAESAASSETASDTASSTENPASNSDASISSAGGSSSDLSSSSDSATSSDVTSEPSETSQTSLSTASADTSGDSSTPDSSKESESQIPSEISSTGSAAETIDNSLLDNNS
jgi:hypothetical protein